MDQLTNQFENIDLNEVEFDLLFPPWTDYEAHWNKTVHKLIEIFIRRRYFNQYEAIFDSIGRNQSVKVLHKSMKILKCKSIIIFHEKNYNEIREILIKWSIKYGIYTVLSKYTNGIFNFEHLTTVADADVDYIELFNHNKDCNIFEIFYDFKYSDYDPLVDISKCSCNECREKRMAYH